MRKRSGKISLLVLTAALLVGFMVTGVLGQSEQIKVIVPEEPRDSSAEVPLVVGPLILPPIETKWESVNDMGDKARQMKSPIAYLNPDENKAFTPLVCFLNVKPQFDESERSFAILSVVKYEEGNSATMVTLSEASPATCRSGAVFGASTIPLDNGEKAFLWEGPQFQYPRSLAIVRGNMIITIATTENFETLIKMANSVVNLDQDGNIIESSANTQN